MMQTHILALFITLIVVTRADYFAGILVDQKLAKQTTNAINSLKANLLEDFDCSDNSRGIKQPTFTEMFNLGLGGLNLFIQPMKPLSLFQTFFKRNNDKSILTFNSPINKCSFDSFNGTRKKNEIYSKCVSIAKYLSIIKEIFKKMNNIVIGQQNKVIGNKNFVAGSKSSIKGNNNWVFTSDLTLNSIQDGVLIIGNYLIELIDINMIPKNPNEAIRCISSEDSNSRYNKWWGEASNKSRIWL